jgi:hypothetical protein
VHARKLVNVLEKSLLVMAYRKICNVITGTKHYVSGKNSQRLASYGLFCQFIC